MKKPEDVYMEIQEKYPPSFGAYVLPDDWEIEAMEKYADQFKPKWINRHHQPPHLGQRCLVLLEKGGEEYTDFISFGNGGFLTDNEYITYWMSDMPAPKPVI